MRSSPGSKRSLRSGGGAELVPELERLVSEHPLRERLLSSLMLALYRAGRQTDALEAFRSTRERLVEELGLEPGPELHELQRRILQHDPITRSATPFLRPPESRSRRTVAVAVVLVLAASWLGSCSAPARLEPAAYADGRGQRGRGSGPDAGQLVTATPLPGAPSAAAMGAGSVWVADPGDGTVSRVDPRSGVVIDRIPVGGDPGSIVSGDGAIWVASTVGSTVIRIDPATETVTQTILLAGANPDAIAYGAGRLWVADSSTRELFEIDPTTGARLRTISLEVSPARDRVRGGRALDSRLQQRDGPESQTRAHNGW